MKILEISSPQRGHVRISFADGGDESVKTVYSKSASAGLAESPENWAAQFKLAAREAQRDILYVQHGPNNWREHDRAIGWTDADACLQEARNRMPEVFGVH